MLKIDEKSLEIINNNRKKIKERISKEEWDLMLSLEEQYRDYNFMYYDLPKFELDDKEKFLEIFNSKHTRTHKQLIDIADHYHIEKEPTPSAFRREHILNQVRYILETSFAGREHMLIKYMSVEIGKSQFLLHVITIENVSS